MQLAIEAEHIYRHKEEMIEASQVNFTLCTTVWYCFFLWFKRTHSMVWIRHWYGGKNQVLGQKVKADPGELDQMGYTH